MGIELIRPDGTAALLPLPEIEPGVFQIEIKAAQIEVYRIRLRAAGRIHRREEFAKGICPHGCGLDGQR